jgi:hypothetical protein
VAIEEAAGFIEIALQRQRNDNGTARATYAKRQPPRARVAANFKLSTNVFKSNGSRLRRKLSDVPSLLDPHALCPPKPTRIMLML